MRLLAAVALLLACGKSDENQTTEQVAKELAPKLDPLLAVLTSLPKQLDTIAEKPLEKAVATQALESDNKGVHTNGNAIVVIESDLRAIDNIEKAPVIRGRPYLWGQALGCYFVARQSKWLVFSDRTSVPQFDTVFKPKGFNVKTMCSDFLAAQYLVVVRFGEVKNARAAIDKPEDLGKRAEGFYAGAGSGVAFVFALPGGQYLGSKAFSAKSADTVHTMAEAGEDEFERNLKVSAAASDDLMRNIDNAIRTALASP